MIIILCGKSGAGKDRIMKDFIKLVDSEPITSYTTRPMRFGEVDGIEYHFVSKDMFYYLSERNFFSDVRQYNTLVGGKQDTWYYGSPTVNPKSKLYVTILDLQGAEEYIKFYGKQNCFVVYVNVSDEERERRARERGSFDKTEWDRRLADDNVKFAKEKVDKIADIILDNEDSNYDPNKLIGGIGSEVRFSRTMKIGGKTI